MSQRAAADHRGTTDCHSASCALFGSAARCRANEHSAVRQSIGASGLSRPTFASAVWRPGNSTSTSAAYNDTLAACCHRFAPAFPSTCHDNDTPRGTSTAHDHRTDWSRSSAIGTGLHRCPGRK